MNTTAEKNTPEESKKTTKNILFDAVNCIGGAVWDLKIIENAIATGVANEQIVIPDIDNDPLRIALLALQTVRANLEEQETTLWARMHEEKDNAEN